MPIFNNSQYWQPNALTIFNFTLQFPNFAKLLIILLKYFYYNLAKSMQIISMEITMTYSFSITSKTLLFPSIIL